MTAPQPTADALRRWQDILSAPSRELAEDGLIEPSGRRWALTDAGRAALPAMPRTCVVCGNASDAAECTRCVIDGEIVWKRRSDQ